ncbi:MAG: Csa1 family protein [Bacilli bacterium]
MKRNRKITVFIAFLVGLLLFSIIGGSASKRRKIEYALKNFTDLYPTEDLNIFYDMRGYRGSTFEKSDKGSWYIFDADSSYDDKGKRIYELVSLKMDCNTRKAYGYYELKFYKGDKEIIEKYYFDYIDGKFIFNDDLNTKKASVDLIKKMDEFKFGLQYLDFQRETLNELKYNGVGYSASVPMYRVEYKFSETDKNLVNFYEHNPHFKEIPMVPKLVISGSGLFNERSLFENRMYKIYTKVDDRISSSYGRVYYNVSNHWDEKGDRN